MSRLFAIVVSLIHMAGGLLTGYYAYAYRVAVENPVDGAVVFDIAWMTMLGPLLILMAFGLHLSQVGRAKRADRGHTKKEEELNYELTTVNIEKARLHREAAEAEKVLEFCRQAIAKGAERGLPPFGSMEEIEIFDTPPTPPGRVGDEGVIPPPGYGPELKRQVAPPKDFADPAADK